MFKKNKRKRKEGMYFDTLSRELTEIIALSFSFKGIEAVGKDLFYNTYSTHELEKLQPEITISPHVASARLVYECMEANRIPELISYLMQLEGNYLYGKIVHIFELDTFLFHLSENGYVYDAVEKKILPKAKHSKYLPNWGALKEGKAYEILIASIDICENSKLVHYYGANNMERIYNQLHNYLDDIVHEFEGRIWSWQGDGGIIAFRGRNKIENGLNCAFKVLLNLPLFNIGPKVTIRHPINLRIGMDCGYLNFFSDVGRIVSETINYAAHLEKKGTKINGISISDKIYKDIPERFKVFFSNSVVFEERTAYSMGLDYKSFFGLNGDYKPNDTPL